MASAGRAPLPGVLPPSGRTGDATPAFGTIVVLDHVNHADEDGSCSISYSPLPTVTLDAANCDIDLLLRHVMEVQEYDTAMTLLEYLNNERIHHFIMQQNQRYEHVKEHQFFFQFIDDRKYLSFYRSENQ